MPLPVLTGTATLAEDPDTRHNPAGHPRTRVRLTFTETTSGGVGPNPKPARTFFIIGATTRPDIHTALIEMKRGDTAAITGRLVSYTWTDRDGKPAARPELLIDSITAENTNHKPGATTADTNTPRSAAAADAHRR